MLIYEVGELEDQLVDRYDQYRVTIKSIRNIEASVQPSRDRKNLLLSNLDRGANGFMCRQAENYRSDRSA